MDAFAWIGDALLSMVPPVLVGLLFWVIMRSILRADATERKVYSEIEAEERAKRASGSTRSLWASTAWGSRRPDALLADVATILARRSVCRSASSEGDRVVVDVELKGVKKNYGPVTAIHNLNLAVEKGEFCALLGPSGVGKSSIINRLLGSDLLKTADVRASDSRGRHTSVHRQLVELPGGGLGMEKLLTARNVAEVDQAAQEPDHARPRGVLGQRDEGHAVVPGGGADLGQVGHPRPEQDGGDAAPPGCRYQPDRHSGKGRQMGCRCRC